MKTPEGKTISFTFHSQPLKDLKCRWKATVTFPAGADDETFASVTLADGEGVEIESGEFEFAGMRIAVKDGKGSFRCGDFTAGKHAPAVWVYRPGVSPVPGMLTFE